LNDQAFIFSLQKGDNDSFRILIDKYRDRIYNTSLGIVQNYDDAEDLVQEVFVEVFQSINSFRGDSKLSTWIYQITVRKSLDEIRRKKRKKSSGLIQRLFKNEDNEPLFDKPDLNHPGVILENKEKANILFKAIDILPKNQKVAFTLHKMEGLSYIEISEIMKMSVGAIESLMQRAKENLRKYLYVYYSRE